VFETGLKVTVTPRIGQPIDLVVRGCFTDDATELMYEIAVVYGAIVQCADPCGNTDLKSIFRPIPVEVFTILERTLEGQIDGPTLRRLDNDDLLHLLAAIFDTDKQYHAQRIQDLLVEVGLL